MDHRGRGARSLLQATRSQSALPGAGLGCVFRASLGRKGVIGHRDAFCGNLLQRKNKKIRCGGAFRALWRRPDAGNARGGPQAGHPRAAHAQPFFRRAPRRVARNPGERGAGHLVPEPAWFFAGVPLRTMRLVRLLCALRREPYLPQEQPSASLPLLQLPGTAGTRLPFLRQYKTVAARLWYREDRG